jgi:hypothetical protein
MRHQRSAAGLVAAAILIAACGGGGPGSATQGPGAQATQTGGGGGGNGSKPAGWDAKGKVHYEFSGGISKSGDLGYLPVASVFGAGGAASLSYTVEGGDEVLTIAINAGQLSVSYGSSEFTAPAAVCTTSNLNVSAPNASGSFDCNEVVFIPVSGAMIQGGHLTGSFDAHN